MCVSTSTETCAKSGEDHFWTLSDASSSAFLRRLTSSGDSFFDEGAETEEEEDANRLLLLLLSKKSGGGDDDDDDDDDDDEDIARIRVGEKRSSLTKIGDLVVVVVCIASILVAHEKQR